MMIRNLIEIEFVKSNRRSIDCRTVNGPMRVNKRGRLLPIECDPKFDDIVISVTLAQRGTFGHRVDPHAKIVQHRRLSHIAIGNKSWYPVDCTVAGSKVVWYIQTGPKFHPGIITRLTTADKRHIEKAITLYVTENLA